MGTPRLAESASELWERFVEISARRVFESHYGFVSPVARFKTYTFCVRDRRLCLQDWRTLSDAPATDYMVDRFFGFLERDCVAVFTQTPPGLPSDYQEPRVLRVIHQPAGQWGEAQSIIPGQL